MSVLLTIALVTSLFRGSAGKNRGSFLNPKSIRTRLEKLPESDRRERALAMARELEKIGRAYIESVTASLNDYVAKAKQHSSTTDDLIAQRRAADAAFAQVLRDILRIRQSLLDTLSPEEWDEVFG